MAGGGGARRLAEGAGLRWGGAGSYIAGGTPLLRAVGGRAVKGKEGVCAGRSSSPPLIYTHIHTAQCASSWRSRPRP